MEKKKKRGTHLLKEKILPLISFPILWRSVLHRYWKYFSTQAKGICNCIYISCLSTDHTKLTCQTKTFLWTLLSPLRPEARSYLESHQDSMCFWLQPHSSWALFHSFHGIFYLMNSALQKQVEGCQPLSSQSSESITTGLHFQTFDSSVGTLTA